MSMDSDYSQAVDNVLIGFPDIPRDELRSRILWLLGMVEMKARGDAPAVISVPPSPNPVAQQITPLKCDYHPQFSVPRDCDDDRQTANDASPLPTQPLFTCEICHTSIPDHSPAWVWGTGFGHVTCIEKARLAED